MKTPQLVPNNWAKERFNALYCSKITFQEHDGSQLTSGDLDPAGFDDVAGLEDIPCSVQEFTRIAPERRGEVTVNTQAWKVFLNDSFALKTDYRAVVDGDVRHLIAWADDSMKSRSVVQIERAEASSSRPDWRMFRRLSGQSPWPRARA